MGLTAALALATAIVAATVSAADAGPAPAAPASAAVTDPFYVPPSPLPAGAPGDILKWRPTTLGTLALIVQPAAATAYQIMYLSQDTAGKPIAVTGTIIVPKNRSTAAMPIVGYAPTTHGIGDKCAASVELTSGGDTDLVNINDAVTRGWAVADTDYEGLGTPGDHTYVVGRAEAHALLDVVRAARKFTTANLPKDGPVVLWGYSQGGGAASWAAQLAGSYAPELKVKGTAAGGTPADLAVVAGALNKGPGFAYLMMAASGLSTAYPELNLASYLNDKGRAALVDLQENKCVNDALLSYAFGSIDQYTTANPLDNPQWQKRIAEQKIGTTKPSAPVFLYHGFQDEFIPWKQADQLRKDWCSLGASVKMNSYLGEHISTFLSGASDAQTFLADRLAGRTVSSSC